MMLSLLGSIALFSGVATSSDPSLSAAAACGVPTQPLVTNATSELESGRLLLGYQGVVLYWSEASASFSMSIDGTPVGDLSSRATAHSRYEFSGRFVAGQPTLTGAVDNPNGTTWLVELNVPGRRPATFVVQAAGDSIQILSGTICDCSDRTTLTCKPGDCSGTTVKCGAEQKYICKFYPVVIDPNP
ncbi:MAG: hypothetical protein IT432_03505 [Phycisphaerales bacterium]|nr:hypothetical protein [Phycisphaerales bacterium]